MPALPVRPVRRPVESPPPASGRRWETLALLLVLVLFAALVSRPTTSDDVDLLGSRDGATGRSSLLPPADHLQLLWERHVDVLPDAPPGPPRLLDLGDRVVVGDEVVDPAGEAPSAHLPAHAVPDPQGHVLVADGEEVVEVDARTGGVRHRATLVGGGGWRPVGAARGWVAGAAVLRDAEGVIGVVERHGRVRWVGDPMWSWTPAGDGTDWAVVVAPDGPSDRLLVVDGRDGSVHRDVGPVGVVHAPVVQADTLAWVDPHGGLDRGLGRPVEVHGVRLDGSGRIWAATDLPPTTGQPQDVRLEAAGGAGLLVHYATAGDATTATLLDPVDGSHRRHLAVTGSATTEPYTMARR